MSSALFYSLVMGLFGGLACAYLFERLDDRVNSLEEMERVTGIATVGLIPKVSSSSTVDDEVADPRSALSEAYRSLCTSLQFAAEGGLPKSLLITSAGPSEGKSVTAMSVARHFSTMGLKVLLVDADLRKPSLHTKLNLDNSVGLSNYLTGSCTPPDAFQQTQTVNLTFMGSGPVPPNPADLLAGTRMMSLISVGLQVFDLIVVDGPPVMGIADAPLLSNVTASTVFVAAAGQARFGLMRGALKRLQAARAPVIGTVLTKFDARRVGYGYGYGYGYGGGYGYGNGSGSAATAAAPAAASVPPALASAAVGPSDAKEGG
jgi:polysaccharide biosynthesis transport protein